MPTTPDPLPDRFRAGTDPDDRFARRASSIAALLGHRLEAVLSQHDLTVKRLWAAHRAVAELQRQDRVPTPTEYWEETAQPAARHFLDEATRIVDAERDELTRALQQFATLAGERHRVEPPDPTRPPDVDPAVTAALGIAGAGIDEFVAAASTANRINQVGAWWQGRLRRKAILASAGRLLITPIGRCELELTSAEMKLLSGPPWCHDDRLLSAFELAHSDLRDHVARVGGELTRQANAMIETAHRGEPRRPDRGGPDPGVRTDRPPALETIDLN